ncbi:hypothetical protein MNV49_007306 [Pseudohyphozyma bogoriensis]|nr:hypothetical protein MNV49_007306 [Pseudohyphozyma bogoriensis]
MAPPVVRSPPINLTPRAEHYFDQNCVTAMNLTCPSSSGATYAWTKANVGQATLSYTQNLCVAPGHGCSASLLVEKAYGVTFYGLPVNGSAQLVGCQLNKGAIEWFGFAAGYEVSNVKMTLCSISGLDATKSYTASTKIADVPLWAWAAAALGAIIAILAAAVWFVHRYKTPEKRDEKEGGGNDEEAQPASGGTAAGTAPQAAVAKRLGQIRKSRRKAKQERFSSTSDDSASEAETGALLPSQRRKRFAFGDSYTDINYRPATDGLSGLTSTGGQNWVEYLSAAAGTTLLDLAINGALLNSTIFNTTSGTDFVSQVATFGKYFYPPPTAVPWTYEDALFAIWFGQNDVHAAVSPSFAIAELMYSYQYLIAALYGAGARKFMLVGAAPVHLTPLVSASPSIAAIVKARVATFNTAVANLSETITRTYSGTTATFYNTTPLSLELLTYPSSYGFMSTSYCDTYSRTGNNPDVNSPTCPWPLAEYGTTITPLGPFTSSSARICMPPKLNLRILNNHEHEHVNRNHVGSKQRIDDFAFGDSYTKNGFTPSTNGLSNNVSTNEFTTSGGMNWVEYLAQSADATLIDLAVGGATLNNSIIFAVASGDVVSQVVEFENYYSPAPATVPWTSDNALFTIWIGINDIGITTAIPNANAWSTYQPALLESYASLITTLYRTGARKFLFLSVPPTNLSPLLTGNAYSNNIIAAIADYNAGIEALANAVPTQMSGATSTFYATGDLITTIHEAPNAYGIMSTK